MEREKKPTPKPVLQAWGAYKEARKEAAESKLRRWEVAISRGEDPEVTRLRQQGGSRPRSEGHTRGEVR